MVKTSANCFYIVNLYFPSHFVNTLGLGALSYRPSSFHMRDLNPRKENTFGSGKATMYKSSL